MKIGVTVPSRTAELSTVVDYAVLAEDAGLDSLWHYEVYRSPYTMLALSAARTERIGLASGVAAALTRSPFEAACAIADVDELSAGRAVLGIGTGTPEYLTAFHSSDALTPVARMSEYVDVVRLAWEYLRTGRAENYEGDHYRFRPLRGNPYGRRPHMPREQVPVYLAGMKPRMLALAGEKADGWIGYFPTVPFLERDVLPAIAKGAARAGRDPSEVELVCEVICSVSDDREAAYDRARRQVGFYLMHPAADAPIASLGLTSAADDYRNMVKAEGPGGFAKTPDVFVEAFSITGTPEEARQRLDAFDVPLDHIALHTPYSPPFTAEDSDDAFRGILAAFGRSAADGVTSR